MSVLADVRYGVRWLARSPSFLAVAVLSLGLGIGANSAIFSVVNALLLTPLPVGHPEQLVSIYTSDFSGPPYGGSSYPDALDFAQATPGLADIAASTVLPLSLSQHGESSRVFAEVVSPNYFDVLEVGASLGRVFRASEASNPATGNTVVVSHRFWQRRLGGDPRALGTTLVLNGQPFTLVGVADRSYQGLLRVVALDLWVPATRQLPAGGILLDERGNRGLMLMGRMRPGVSIGVVRAQLGVVQGRMKAAYPAEWTDVQGAGRRITVLSERESRVPPDAAGPAAAFMAVLMSIVGIVLLVACANVAGLLVARALVRRHEFAVRLALGASRARLVRQLLIEAALIGVVAGLAGILVSRVTLAWVARLQPPVPFPIALDFPVDARVLAFTAIVALATVVLFGLAPALQSAGASVVPALRREDVVIRPSRRLSLRGVLVVGQVALSLLLLVVGALFVRGLQRAHTIETGFDVRNVVLVALDPGMLGYDAARGLQAYEQVLDRVRALPGVVSASVARVVPLSFDTGRRRMRPEGYQARQGEDMEVPYNQVGPDYFRTLGIPVARGRDFDMRDREGREGVVMVNEAFAALYWPGVDPLQRHVSVTGDEGPWLRVVGVTRNTKYFSLGERDRPVLYLPFWQHYSSEATIHVKAGGPASSLAASVRAAVRAADPSLPVLRLQTMEETTGAALLPQRVAVGLLGAFGALALLLTTMGLYGVLAQHVEQRTREIGIRLALGAGPRAVVRFVLGQGLALAGAGAVLGLGAAAAAAQLITSFLNGVWSLDPLAYAGALALLASVVLLAMWVPARRAAAVDPAVALRRE